MDPIGPSHPIQSQLAVMAVALLVVLELVGMHVAGNRFGPVAELEPAAPAGKLVLLVAVALAVGMEDLLELVGGIVAEVRPVRAVELVTQMTL